jgi:2-deoxystreptamine N-acetyl-D-glucosaminyltransferase/2-deoxystreptamine glucosyltransferase
MRDGPDDDLHVLRLCSVFEPPPLVGPRKPGILPGELDSGTARFDPIGGMQNHTAALTRCLDGRGLEQTVVTARLAGPRGTVSFGRRARVHRTGLPVARFRQLWALGALPTVLRPPGTRPVSLIHVHQGEDLATLPLGRLAAWRHRCPLVVTVHCSVGHTLRGRSLRTWVLRALGGWIERSSLRRADAVVVLTARTAAALCADGLAPERIVTIPSGFEPSLFAGARGDVLPGVDHPRIGYVGRLASQKRADLLVQAFHRMRRPACLVLVGSGPEAPRIRHLVVQGPSADRITMAGFVEHTAIPAVLAALDVLVLPSAYEEMGSILVEAMAAGLPVVATAVGGIPEVVRDGETGVLVPPADVAALAEALDRLVADPGLRARLSDGARARAGAYSWPRLAEQVADVYRRARTRDAPEKAAA